MGKWLEVLGSGASTGVGRAGAEGESFRSYGNRGCGSHGRRIWYRVPVHLIAVCPLFATKSSVTPLIVRMWIANCGLVVFGCYGRPFKPVTCANEKYRPIWLPLSGQLQGDNRKTGRVAAIPQPGDGAP